MLEKLLHLIESNETLSSASIARQLNTTPQMVEVMLEELARKGKLHQISSNQACDANTCNGCAFLSHCNSSPSRIWSLEARTPKNKM